MVRRDVILAFFFGLLIMGPAGMVLTLYVMTGNPSLRPLGITFDQLLEAGQIADRHLIVVEVTTGGTDQLPASRTAFAAAIQRSLETFQTTGSVRYIDRPGAAASVTYVVGDSRIGPFPPTHAADGIRAAAQAERMLAQQRRKRDEAAEQRLSNESWWVRALSD